MPIPLGFWATAGSGGAETGAMELISSSLVSSTTSSVTFSSIPQTYKHLQIRAVVRGADARTDVYARMRINGSSSLYSTHQLYGYGSGVGSNYLSEDSLTLTSVSGANGTANTYGGAITDILDYTSTTKNKTIRTLGGIHNGSSPWIALNSGLYISTSAITSLTYYVAYGSVVPGGGIAAGSRISLYGIKG